LPYVRLNFLNGFQSLFGKAQTIKELYVRKNFELKKVWLTNTFLPLFLIFRFKPSHVILCLREISIKIILPNKIGKAYFKQF
jgi:hypothetical protein